MRNVSAYLIAAASAMLILTACTKDEVEDMTPRDGCPS